MTSQADAMSAGFSLKIGGSDVSREFLRSVFEVEVEQNLHLPDLFTIRVHLGATGENPFDVVDGLMKDYLSKGSEVEIAYHVNNTDKVISVGEINSITLDLSSTVPGSALSALIQGYDKSHRLHRGRHTRTFLKSTYSDVVKKVGGEAKLDVAADSTSGSHDFILQHNQTDWEFLREIADRIGYELTFDRKSASLWFKKPWQAQGSAVGLEWDKNLFQFRVRTSTVFQSSEVTVLGWDPIKKERIVGTARNGNGSPKLGDSRSGADQAKSAFGEAKMVMVDTPMLDQEEARAMAQSLADAAAADFVHADGVAFGNPDLKPGVTVKVTQMGKRFSGEYYVTGTTHRFSQMDGYSTSFVVSGRSPNTLLSIMGSDPGSKAGGFVGGVVVALVTNAKDPENLSRVKLKYPWLSDELESDWARIAAPGAGADRGMQWLPEVNDEVLVAFEHGDINRPYILGGLWNKKDKPPSPNSEAIASDKTKLRRLTSREGLNLLIDDEKHIISIAGPQDNTKIEIRHDDKVVEILSNGDINIKGAQGKITVEGQDLEIKSSTNLKLSATGSIEISAGTNVNLDAQVNLELKGLNALLEGATMATVKAARASVEGSAMTTIKGGVVMIN